jgi:hypothetical protein
MGIGSISMANLRQLPPTAVLRKWLKHTSRAMDAALNTRQVRCAGGRTVCAWQLAALINDCWNKRCCSARIWMPLSAADLLATS